MGGGGGSFQGTLTNTRAATRVYHSDSDVNVFTCGEPQRKAVAPLHAIKQKVPQLGFTKVPGRKSGRPGHEVPHRTTDRHN